MSRNRLPELLARRHPVIATAARRPVALTVLVAATLIIGAIAYSRIELALIPPGLESRNLSVELQIRAIGSQWSPEEVERRIGLIVEGELATVPGIETLETSSERDEAEFDIAFSGDTDLREAYAAVRDRVDRARSQIGDIVDHPRIRRFSMGDMPIAAVSIVWEPWVENPWDKLNNRVKPAIEAAEGIANIEAWGEVQPYFRVALDRRKLAALRDVGVRELIEKLQGDNFSMPAGRISEETRDTHIVIDTRFQSLEQLRNVPVTDQLRLSDVANVTESYSANSYVFSYIFDRDQAAFDGGRGVYCRISKASDASIVKAGDGLKAALRELEQDPHLNGFKFRINSNQGDDIVDQLAILQETLLIGGVLAVLVLMLFVKRFRLALIISLSIPLSMTMALVVMYFTGEYLSMLALMGFTVAAGMLLDNAIVVSENIYRRLAIDRQPFQAAVLGASEVGLALALATSTTIVVFLSVAFFNDSETGRFMMARLGVPICFSLGFSILVALAIIPCTMSRVFRGGDGDYGLRGKWYTAYRWLVRSPVPVRWLAGPLAAFLGRAPGIPANVQLGSRLEASPRSGMWWGCIWLVGLGAGIGTGLWAFQFFGGEEFWSPIQGRLEAFIKKITDAIAEMQGTVQEATGGRGGRGGGGRGGAPAPVYPSIAAIGMGLGATLLVPLVAVLLPTSRQASSQSPVISRASEVYGRMIGWLLKRPLLVLCYISVALGGLIFTGLAMTEFTQSNTGTQQSLFFRIRFPENLKTQEDVPDLSGTIPYEQLTRDWQYVFRTREILFGLPYGVEGDPSLRNIEAERRAFEQFGLERGALSLRSWGGMMCFLRLDSTRSADAKMLEERIRDAFPPFAGFRVSGGFDMSQANQMRVVVKGPEYGRLIDIRGQLARRMETMDTLSNVSDGTEDAGNTFEAIMQLDFARAMGLGVSPESFARIMRFQVAGEQLSDFMRGEETRPVRLVYEDQEDRSGERRETMIEDLMRVPIPRQDGSTTVESVIKRDVRVSGAAEAIKRVDGQAAITITANPTGSSEAARAQIEAAVAEMDLPDGYTAEIAQGAGGERRRGRRGREGPENPLSPVSLLAAMLLITIVMAFLFESLTRPLVVLLACVPGAVAGALWALVMSNTMFDALCGLGVVVLLGVAVNNGIVFVDLINRLRAEGLSMESAVRQAGEQRLRPMLMTSATTVAGLIPMAISATAFFDMPYYPLARTILGGMILSTLITLVAVPVWYGVIEAIREYTSTTLSALFRGGKGKG